MRPWIRWSSLALALCNTGCLEDADVSECQPGTPAPLEVSQKADLVALIKARCSVVWRKSGEKKAFHVGTSVPYTSELAVSQPTYLVIENSPELDVDENAQVTLKAPAQVGQLLWVKLEFVPSFDNARKGGADSIYVRQEFVVGSVAGELLQVVPTHVDLDADPAPFVTLLASFGTSTDAGSVSWEVVGPDGRSNTLLANSSQPGRFEAAFSPQSVGVYSVRAVVDGSPRRATTVEVNRRLRFDRATTVLGWAQSNKGVAYVQFPLLTPLNTTGAMITTAARLDDTLPPELASQVSVSDTCGRARLLNRPENTAAGLRIAATSISTFVLTDGVTMLEQVGQTTLSRCRVNVVADPATSIPTIVDQAAGACSQAVWTNEAVNLEPRPDPKLGTGVYRIDACAVATSGGPFASGDLLARCDARKTVYLGFVELVGACAD